MKQAEEIGDRANHRADFLEQQFETDLRTGTVICDRQICRFSETGLEMPLARTCTSRSGGGAWVYRLSSGERAWETVNALPGASARTHTNPSSAGAPCKSCAPESLMKFAIWHSD